MADVTTANTLEAEHARELPPHDLEVLRHALGFDSDGSPRPEAGRRSSFCAGVGTTDHRACERLSAAGLMTPGRSINEGSDRYFHATEAGRAAVEARRPPAPQLTRAQKRYRAWLAADCGLSFGEWLRTTSASAEAA